MKKDLKELDRLLTNIVKETNKENDIKQLKTILIKHLHNLGATPMFTPDLLELKGFDLELQGFDLELKNIEDVELKPLDLDLELLDPCPKKRDKK